jgi:uncharacterized membrane protein YbhN (UPF0104 family)
VVELSMIYLYSTFVPSYIIGVLVRIWRAITYFTNIVVGAFFIHESLGFGNRKP